MSKIYDALNELGSNPFEPNNAALTDRAIQGTAVGLTKELAEFEKLFVERIGRLSVAADEAQTAVTSESQKTAQTIEKLKGEIGALDTRLKETKEILERKDLANQVLERNLTATVNQLKSEVKKTDETLASRVSEVNALKSEVNRLRDGIRGMVSVFNQQAQALGGQPVENSRMAAFAEPSLTEAHHPASSQVANPSSMFVVSDASSNTVITPSTFER